MRLNLDWRNEAAWAYLRGYIAVTPEEAKQSEGTNAPRIHVKKLDGIWSKLQKWRTIAETPEFSMELAEGLNPVVLGDEMEAVAQMRYDGLRKNRHFYAVYIDFAVGFGQKELVQEALKIVMEFDKMRTKFWHWRKQQIDELMK